MGWGFSSHVSAHPHPPSAAVVSILPLSSSSHPTLPAAAGFPGWPCLAWPLQQHRSSWQLPHEVMASGQGLVEENAASMACTKHRTAKWGFHAGFAVHVPSSVEVLEAWMLPQVTFFRNATPGDLQFFVVDVFNVSFIFIYCSLVFYP